MDISKYAKHLRKKANLTQTQLARRLGYTSSQFVSNWERGLSEPPIPALIKMAKLAGVAISSVRKTYIMEMSSRIRDEFDEAYKELKGRGRKAV